MPDMEMLGLALLWSSRPSSLTEEDDKCDEDLELLCDLDRELLEFFDDLWCDASDGRPSVEYGKSAGLPRDGKLKPDACNRAR